MLLNYSKTDGWGGAIGNLIKGKTAKKILSSQDNVAFLKDAQSMFDNKGQYVGQDASETIEENAKLYRDLDDSVKNYVKDVAEGNIKLKEGQTLLEGYRQQSSALTTIGKSIKNIWGQFVSTIVNGLVSMGASWVLAKSVQYIQDIVNSYENLAKEVETISSKYTEQKNQLQDYSDKIVKLRGVMEDSSSTTQEVKDATSQLYGIQNDLIQQYGAYHDNINIVNGDLEEQLSLLQGINKENSQKSIDEINAIRSSRSSGINVGTNVGKQYLSSILGLGGGLVSLFKQSDAYFEKLDSGDNFWQALIHTFTEQDSFNGEDIGEAVMGKSTDQIKRMFEEYESTFKVENDKIRGLMSAYKDVFKFNGDEVTITGSVKEINDAVTNLRIQMDELGITDDAVFSNLNKVAIETQKRITTYGSSYDTIIENEIIKNEKLSGSYSELTKKYNEYIAAQNKGDTEKVKQLGEEYVDLYAKLAESDIDDKYLEYFKNLYPELQTLISNWEFESTLNLKLNSESEIDDVLQELNDKGLGKYSKQIQDGSLYKFGNVDTNNRAVIKWTQELKNAYLSELESLNWNPEIGSISTVAGGTMGHTWNGKTYEIAYTPLLQTEDGAVPLSADEIDNYLDMVFEKAGEDGDISFDEILQIDAEGFGSEVGGHFIHGLIAGIGNYGDQAVRDIGELMHYTGENGAYNLARQQVSAHEDLASDIKRNSADELLSRYEYYQATKDSGLISPEISAKFDLLTDLAAEAGMTVDQYIVALKSTREYSDSMQHLRDLMGGNWDEDFAEKLSDANLEALVDIKPKEDGLAYTKEEIEEYLSPLQIEVEPNIKDSSAVKSLNDLESNWAGLDTVYQSTVNTPGTADAKDIESVNSAMGGVSKAGDEDINVLTNALEAYNTALVENKGNAQAAQEAVDKLATAYVDQSDILENLDEDNKDYYIDMLKNNGVTNAEEVVLSRLTKQAKETSKALKSLSKSLVDNYDILKQGKSAEGYNSALEDVQSKVKGLLQVYNEDGSVNMDLTPEINESFVTENLEDIKAATEGDIEALQRLRTEVARLNASKAFVGIDLPYDVIQGELNHIMDMVAQADAMDIEVGSYIDDSQFMAALAEMMSGSSETANAVAAAFESMGYTVEWAPKKATAIVPDMTSVAGASGVAGGNPANAAMRTSALEMNVPELRIKRSSSNSGSKVSFGGAPSGGSSGGGGGGGGGDNSSKSKVNKDTKETFDWIEVKLKRLQEAVQRLDKTATNMYKSWTTRNTALKDEIAKVTEEITVQQHAAERYAKNAEKLTNKKVNVAPKAKDYEDGKKDKQYKYDLKQYKKAEKEWKSGKYQKLIREGKIGKNDIEQIKNKYLVELINQYTEIYQKSVDASDAVQDLRKDLQDLNRTGFDNLIKEWDQIIELTENETNLVDKYMDRTETMGYWISDKFYKNQRYLTEKMLKDSEAQLKAAVDYYNNWKKQQEDNGGFNKDSEGARELQAEIQGLNEKTEEYRNELAKLDKQIQELSWEKFDWLQEKLDDITDEAQTLSELLTFEKTFDDFGFFNNRGVANLAMLGTEYENNARKLQDYMEQRKILKEQLAKDPLNRVLKDELDETNKNTRSIAKEMVSGLESIASTFKESIDQNLAKLKELMDEYKQTLSSAKDLYDFQKNIGNQTKQIENLRKQLTAYQGDDSEAARKRRQELTNQLSQAEQQLQETEWDRYISQTGEMLDNLYEDYEENLNSRLDNLLGLLPELVREVNENRHEMVAEGLKDIKNIFGIEFDNLESYTTKDGKQLLSGINGGKLADDVSKFKDIVDEMKTDIKEMQEPLSNEDVFSKIFENSNKIVVNSDGSISVKPVTEESVAEDEYNAAAEKIGVVTTEKTFDDYMKNGRGEGVAVSIVLPDDAKINSADITSGKLEDTSKTQTFIAQNLEEKVGEVFADKTLFVKGSKKKSEYGDLNEYLYEKNKGYVLTKEGLSTLRKLLNVKDDDALFKALKKLNNVPNVKGFATGSKHILSNQLAWTQEKGSELIFRRSDGAMLTPLGSGDMVFTHSMSRTLWELAKEYEHLKIATGSVPDIKSNVATTINQNNQIEITLPNVNDYASFKYELQNDIKFEKFIQEITLGQAMGNNTLNKRKY